MYTKKIKYTDFDGNEREDELLFHLSKAEVIQWLMTDGDYTLDKKLERIAKNRNGKQIMDTFADLIERSYGEKSLDGRRFMKTPEIFANFKETEAYSILFVELVSDAKKAAEFVNNIIPKDLADAVAKLVEENHDVLPDEYKDYLLAQKG